jgi:hypothetical protein
VTLPRWLPPFLLALGLAGGAGCSGTAWVADDDGDDDDDDDDDSFNNPGGDDDDTTPALTPEGVVCTPSSPSFTFSYLEPVIVSLDVQIEWSDGSVSSPDGDVSFTILHDFGGSVNVLGVYTSPLNHGGLVEIEAWYDGNFGLCTFELFIELEINEVGDETLDDVIALTPAAIDDACGPPVVYPLAGALMPRDLPPPVIQWSNPAGSNLFVVSLQNQYASLTVTTTSTSWRPDAGQWFALSDPSAGTQVAIQVSGGLWDGVALSNFCTTSAPLEFSIGEFGSQSTVFYWSPSTSGLWKLDVGSEAAESWLGPANAGDCVGCHSANLANASRLAANFGGGNGWSVVVDVADPLPPIVGPNNRPGNFMTLSPSGTRLVRSYLGTLYLDDVDNNVQLATLPTVGYATHPDWSPDGTRIVYSSCGNADADWVAYNCSIATLDVLPDDSFGASEVLIPVGGSHYYYPSWNPTSEWIGFAWAPAGGDNPDSNDNPRGQVGIVSAAGGTPKLLGTASGGEGLSNSWPRWGPAEGTIGWMAFSSRRAYGNDLAGGEAQIWLAGVDLTAASIDPDPSYAPIWLPGQSTAVGNHTPIWVPRYTGPE